MKRIAIIGAGIAGLSIGTLLKEAGRQVKIFDRNAEPGGLIRCKMVEGNLYHIVGGHIFNSKNKEVLEWFWKHFDRDNDFDKIKRNASVIIEDGTIVKYPIEDHIYMLPNNLIYSFINDVKTLSRPCECKAQNFEEFLLMNFGPTLYNEYFKPYNEKIWKMNLQEIPLSWLEGKLPMPSFEDMLYHNIKHQDENAMVHSTFFYPRCNGSQFIANTFAKELDIKYDTDIHYLNKKHGQWVVDGELFTDVIFCGNIKELPILLKGNIELSDYSDKIHKLKSHGTTSVLCKIDPNDYSWIYLPNRNYSAHRIICTGNFSPNNNNGKMLTATIEFTDQLSKDAILNNLRKIPYAPTYMTHCYTKYTYPIQDSETRLTISGLKKKLAQDRLYLLGRFAEWEYFNMDAVMESAMKLLKGTGGI